MFTRKIALDQIESVLQKYSEAEKRTLYRDFSDLTGDYSTSLVTLMGDTIRRFAPPASQYAQSASDILTTFGSSNSAAVPHLAGVLKALRTAYDAGYLETVTDLIRSDLFADFLEMADHLLSEGYKDPAAVVAGSVLEEHLRNLCRKYGIPTDSGGRPKKADQLNADLCGNSAYSKLDQKSVTAWLDLRNKAAHGRYSEYAKEQVALLIQSIRDFMTRVPA